MHLNQLTELITVEAGHDKTDAHGGVTTVWQTASPLWAHVAQRVRPRAGSWEGGQAHFVITYEIWMDGAVTLPGRCRFKWQGQTFYPMHPAVYQKGTLWKMVTVSQHHSDAGDRP